MVADQHRRRSIFDDLDALGLQITLAWRNMFSFMSVGKDILSFEERIRMQNDRYPWPAVTFNQSDQPSRMIRVPVAKHDGMQLIGLYLQCVHIVQHTVDGYPRIEEEGIFVAVFVNRHEHVYADFRPELRP